MSYAPIRPRWQRWLASWLPSLIGYVTFAPRVERYTPSPPPAGLSIDQRTGTISGIPTTGTSGVFRVLVTEDGWRFVRPVSIRLRDYRWLRRLTGED